MFIRVKIKTRGKKENEKSYQLNQSPFYFILKKKK